jgi:mono/diheme cytochrome c family protein
VLADRTTADRGRHIAHIACVECHGPQLQGAPCVGATPPLLVVKAYSEEHVRTLMRTGITAGGTESASGLMSDHRAAGVFSSALTDA